MDQIKSQHFNSLILTLVIVLHVNLKRVDKQSDFTPTFFQKSLFYFNEYLLTFFGVKLRPDYLPYYIQLPAAVLLQFVQFH